MNTNRYRWSASLVALAIGAVPLAGATVALSLVADPAIAKNNDNGGGNGGGNGSDNGNGGGNGKGGEKGGSKSGGNGNGGGKSQGASASGKSSGGGFLNFGKKEKTTRQAKGQWSPDKMFKSLGAGLSGKPKTQAKQAKAEPVPEDPKVKTNHGAVASNLKGLNAAHASETARLNASPGSRVGLVAQYEEATHAVIALSQDLAELTDRIDPDALTLEEIMDEHLSEDATMTPEELGEAIDALDPEADDFAEDLETIAAAMTGLDPEDPANAGELEEVAEGIASALEQADLNEELAEVEEDLDAAQGAQVDALAAAYAPHDVEELTEAGLQELHALMGLSADVIPMVPSDDADDTGDARPAE